MSNGKEQIAAADQAWQPEELAGFRVGDLADVPTLGRVEVVALRPPSTLEVRTQTGTMAHVRWPACAKVRG